MNKLSVLPSVLLMSILPIVASAAATSSAPSEETGVLLADGGKARAVIVWNGPGEADADKRHFRKDGREYVQSHLPWAIEQVSGARLEVTTTMPATDMPAIVVGKALLPAEARKRLDAATKRPDTRILLREGQRIYLAGAGASGDAGAVADFIHDELGVHLYGPDPVQWCIPHKPTLRVECRERIGTPAWARRKLDYDGNTIPHQGELAINYERFQAINGGGPDMQIAASHAWARALPRSLFRRAPRVFRRGER